jgi:E3 ubiquitin-protein ligase RNF1/2
LKLQQSIAETLERQSDAITRRYTTAKATAAAIVRKAQSKFRNMESQIKGRTQGNSADEDPYVENDEQTPGSEPMTRERRSKRRKRETAVSQQEASDDEQGDVQASSRPSRRGNEDIRGETSAANVAKLEGLATWARAGSRSTARNGNLNINNNRLIARATLLLDVLSAASQMEKEIEVFYDPSINLSGFSLMSHLTWH